jgi:hypothetical protein
VTGLCALLGWAYAIQCGRAYAIGWGWVAEGAVLAPSLAVTLGSSLALMLELPLASATAPPQPAVARRGRALPEAP